MQAPMLYSVGLGLERELEAERQLPTRQNSKPNGQVIYWLVTS